MVNDSYFNIRRCFAERLFIYNILIAIIISILTGLTACILKQPHVSNKLIIAPLRFWLSPKPFEKFAFQGALCVVFAFSFYYIFFKKHYYLSKNNYLSNVSILLMLVPPIYVLEDNLNPINYIILILGGVFSLIIFLKKHCYLSKNNYLPNILVLLMLILPIYVLDENLQLINYIILIFWFLFSVILYKITENKFIFKAKNDKYQKLIFIFLLVFSIFLIISWQIYGINRVNNIKSSYWIDLDVVIFPLSQVMVGKHIWVDFPSQYGIYPKLLYPIFKLIPQTVSSFTRVMASILFFSYFCIFYVLLKIRLDKFLFLFGGLAIICLTAENYLFLQGIEHQVMQVWPIRFFCPAFSVLLFYNFIKKKNLRNAAFMSILCSVAVIWNLETGMAIFLSYLGYLIFNFISEKFVDKSKKPNMVRNYIILHVLIFMVLIGGFYVEVILSSGKIPDLFAIIKYQRIFYNLGFGMMPIPKSPSLWMVVMAMYLYGLSYSTYTMKNMNSSIKNELVFYLSLLGIALFVYYEGRSHIYNLPKIAWPAMLIALIFSDAVIKMLKLKVINKSYIYCVALFMSFIFVSGMFLIIKIPYIYKSYMNQQDFVSHKYDEIMTINELNFIKSHLPFDKTCLIISKNQGAYSFELNIQSPLYGPGLTQTLLQSDLNNFIAQVHIKQPKCVFLGKKQSSYDLGVDYNKIFVNYYVVAVNKYKTMYFLKPKN